MSNFLPCGQSPNYKSSEEAQVHQPGEQDQLVGRWVRTQLVGDLSGQLGCFQADGARVTEAVLLVHFWRSSSSLSRRDWTNFTGKKDGERKTRATVTTVEIMLPLGAQMRDCAIPVSSKHSKVAPPRRLGQGSAHWTNSSKNAKLLATAQGQGKGELSMVDTERCLLQLPDMEKLKARAKRPLNRGRPKS
ncbi:hypothetical protein M513_13829 [Trichuris suis]|uniref:Uncharacterized protein n=1 Tax=Trichuris suis TaxID=68888 RepID=A0A085LJZ6_9BILA|nr:hypothetical protein M513_13829 [Trichuris suis]